jgi:hypothetical protein
MKIFLYVAYTPIKYKSYRLILKSIGYNKFIINILSVTSLSSEFHIDPECLEGRSDAIFHKYQEKKGFSNYYQMGIIIDQQYIYCDERLFPPVLQK